MRTQLVAATTDAPKGTFDGPRQSFAVYDDDQLLNAAPWNEVIVAYRHNAPVRIRDIGRAVDAAENTKLAVWAGGVRCILLAVNKQPGANVMDTVDQVRAALPRLQATIAAAIDVTVLADRTQTIRASVADMETTLALRIPLVVAVIFVFLRSPWATIIPAIAVPLSLTGTFAVMFVLGCSLDNLSLMALAIAVGFVVDDAIAMLENIVRHLEQGLKPLEAALKGAGEIGFTIVTLSLSLVAVSIPLLFMSGIVGRLFLFFEHQFDHLLAGYEWGLKRVLKHQLPTPLVFLGTLALTVVLYVVIPKGLFPEQDTGSILGSAEGPQDISSSAMWTHLGAMSGIISRDPDVAGDGYTGGASNYNSGTFFINLKDQSARSASADQIIARLRAQLATVTGANLYLQVLQDIKVGGRLSRTQYQYTLQDASLDELDLWAPKLLARMQAMPQPADVTSDQQADAATATLAIDRDQAGRLGIQPTLIDATLCDAIGQRQVSQYFTQTNSYHVVLEVTPALQADPRLLDQLYLSSPLTAQQVPVSSLMKLDMARMAYLAINHQGQFPAVTLSFNLTGSVALGEAATAIEKAEAALGVRATLTVSFQGTAQAFQTSLATTPYLVAAALLVVYLILGVLYESFVHPLTIISTVPSAGVGALLMLMLFGYDLSVIALIGIIMLIGIVKKNGLMMVDFALNAQREQKMSPEDAIYQACVPRFRPIMMTTMCAILGGLPLMLGSGTGSELRRPLGYTMVGGLLLSQALTLFTTPVVYLYLERASHWRKAAQATA